MSPLHAFVDRLAEEQKRAIHMLARAHAAALAGKSYHRSLASLKGWQTRKEKAK